MKFALLLSAYSATMNAHKLNDVEGFTVVNINE